MFGDMLIQLFAQVIVIDVGVYRVRRVRSLTARWSL
jgi:hypothetical protein